MVNKSKKAITLAEIIIVIFIVGIVMGVFLAMPKKNVGQTDRAKYYVAYDMLKRLQDEQMAENGNTLLNNGPVGVPKSFRKAVDNWLNTIQSGAGVNANTRKARLTNGMILIWNNVTDNFIGDSSNAQNAGVVERRTIIVDIDGNEAYNNTTASGSCAINNQDCHGFILTNDGQVAPTLGDRTDWLTFKVYRFNNDGTTNILTTNTSYNNAVTQYCCRNAINGCITAATDNNGAVTVNTITQAGCGANWGNNGPVFMEAIQPLGK